MVHFAMIGVGGFVAPRHLQAIKDTGNTLAAAVDPNDSVGVLDKFFPQARFFTEIERFDRHLEKLRRQGDSDRVSWVSICSPNYLHDAHIRLALRVHANALCEKPLVISPWNLDQIQELEAEYGSRVFTVLQLRHLPALIDLHRQLTSQTHRGRPEVCLTYITRRGPWYHVSWKGSEERSGGVGMNIGVHFFDLLLWLFGSCADARVHLHQADRMAGTLELEHARVRWFLSVNGEDLPEGYLEKGRSAFRSITIDGQELEFSEGFTDLHTRVYAATLAGQGFGVDVARPSIDLVNRIRQAPLTAPEGPPHPFMK